MPFKEIKNCFDEKNKNSIGENDSEIEETSEKDEESDDGYVTPGKEGDTQDKNEPPKKKTKRLDPMEGKLLKCNEIDDSIREYIHTECWACDEQAGSSWIINMVETTSPTRRRRYTEDVVYRKSTRIYHLYGNDKQRSANGCFSQP